MYKLFNEGSKLSEIAQLIVDEDIAGLQDRIERGWNLNEPIQVTGLLSELPITLALIQNRLKVVEFFLARKVNLNVEHDPAIAAAARNCAPEVLEWLVGHGASIDAQSLPNLNAYGTALYEQRYDLLPVLFRLGLALDADGGSAFRQAVFAGQREAVEFFVVHGLDVNARAPDQVFPMNPTAAGVAAQNNDLELLKYLVANGADVTLKDGFGKRPYSHAVAHGNREMKEFLKALEPPEWHDEDIRAAALKSEGVPEDLIAFLRRDDRRMSLGSDRIGFVAFNALADTSEIAWRRQRVIDLLSAVDNYEAEGFLVWSVKHKKLASLDFEHERLRVLCSWNDFVLKPDHWIGKIFE